MSSKCAKFVKVLKCSFLLYNKMKGNLDISIEQHMTVTSPWTSSKDLNLLYVTLDHKTSHMSHGYSIFVAIHCMGQNYQFFFYGKDY